MASVAELEDALKNADAAGDTEAARVLADALVEARGQSSPQVPSFEQYRQDMGLPERQKPGRLSGEYAGGMLRSVNQFIPFADEVASGVNTAIGYNPSKGSYFDYGPGASYGKNLAAERGALKEFRQDYPYDAMAGEAAPGLATGAGLAKAAASRVPTVAGRMAKALTPAGGSVAGNIMRGASSAAVPGYAYGFAAGEGGAANRIESGQNSALLAALLGGGFTGAAEAAPRAWNAGGRLLKRVTGSQGLAQQSPALRKLAKAIMDGNPYMSPDEAFTHAKMRLEELGPEAVAGDINKQTRMLTGTLYRQGDAPQAVIGDKVIGRQEGVRDPITERLSGGQYGRVSRMLNDLVPEDTLATKTALARPTEPARDLYREAFQANQQVDSPAIRRILKTKSGRKALRMVAEQFDDDMKLVAKPDKELTALAAELRQLGKMADDPTGVGVGKGLKLETLDLLKRKLSDLERQALRAERMGSKTPGEAKALGNLRRMLTKELDNLDVTARAGPKSFKPEGGAYARARSLEQKRLRAKEAFKSGEHFLTKADFRNPDEMRAALAEMTPEELHALRVSGAGVLKRMIGDVPIDRDVTRKLYKVPNLEEKVALLFGDEQTFARYIRGNRSEREMYQLYSEIMGGSQTQQRQAAARSLQGEPAGAAGAALDVMANAPTRPISTALGAIPRAGRAAIEWARKMPEGQRLELAKALMGRDVGALTQQAVIANMSDEARRRLIQALTGANIAATPVAQRPELEPASRY